MSSDFEARRVAAEVLTDFARMFPATRMLDIERNYLASLIVHQVRELLRRDEDDGR